MGRLAAQGPPEAVRASRASRAVTDTEVRGTRESRPVTIHGPLTRALLAPVFL
jgi:hypothetical protein